MPTRINNGFINLWKPPGITSHDCVDLVRNILGIRRVGHGGTLDPLATGVLPIAVGSCTKLIQVGASSFIAQKQAMLTVRIVFEYRKNVHR